MTVRSMKTLTLILINSEVYMIMLWAKLSHK